MKQKFLLSIDRDKNELKLQEQSELEPAKYSTLYNATYNLEDIRSAHQESPEKLKAALLNHSFYPATGMADLILNGLGELLKPETEDTLEILTQDKEVHISAEKDTSDLDVEETVKLDSLLDDAIDDDEGLTEELEIEPDDSDSADYDKEETYDKKKMTKKNDKNPGILF